MIRVETPMRFFLDNAWRRLAGHPEIELNKEDKPISYEELFDRFDSNFIELMKNRIGMGRLRYGSKTSNYRHVAGAKKALAMYLSTGNKEFLVDAANYCMLEFGHPSIEGSYFKAVDDGIHLQTIK